jgi:hypothetical protein
MYADVRHPFPLSSAEPAPWFAAPFVPTGVVSQPSGTIGAVEHAFHDYFPSESPFSSTRSTQPVVQEPAYQGPFTRPFNFLQGPMALPHNGYQYTGFPPAAPDTFQLVPNTWPISPNPVDLPPLLTLPHPPIAEGGASTPRKFKVTSGSHDAPLPESHRKRRGTRRHVEGLENISGALNPSTLQQVSSVSHTGRTRVGYKLDSKKFGLSRDVFICGERLVQGHPQRGINDIFELGDEGLCGAAFVTEPTMWRHIDTAISHVGKGECTMCGRMYAIRKDGCRRHASK